MIYSRIKEPGGSAQGDESATAGGDGGLTTKTTAKWMHKSAANSAESIPQWGANTPLAGSTDMRCFRGSFDARVSPHD
jgi:hypothetical protein